MEEKVRDYGWNRGEKSEEKVRQVLEELKAEGAIKNFGQSLKFYQEDKMGIDFLITTLNGKIIRLQVKTSFSPASQEKYPKRGIHYLVVGEKTLEHLKKEILVILKGKSNNNLDRPGAVFYC